MKALIGASLLFFTYGFQAMAVVYLLCIKYSRAGLLFSVSRQGIVYLPVLFLFSRLWGMTGIFYAQAAADGLTTLLICLFLLKVRARPAPLITE
ncbi:hypothetical protein SDC9_193879 [bioreactor metagenome]|uniref:Polysaccharide biosynthesis protein C-terminal domain-containing protein n=1 Tax=bioreactor metagenome TaxID=1076179 RepID=A0A645IDC3_9ZZZZ